MKWNLRRAVLGPVLVGLSGCIAPPESDVSEGSDDGRTGEAAEAITASDSESDALRAWLRNEDNWPAWSLYNWGTAVQVKDGKRRYDQIILAVPAGAPVQQWLQIHSVDLEDDADGYFDNLVREGRLSALDLIVLAKAFRGLQSAGQLPNAGHLAFELLDGMSKRKRRCIEGTPRLGPIRPDEVSHAGEGGPVLLPGSGKRPDSSGGAHHGPGRPSRGPGSRPRPPLPPPAMPEPSVFQRAFRAINRVAARVFENKDGCNDSCTAVAMAGAYVAYVCSSAAVARAIPQIGIPCGVGETWASVRGFSR